MPVKCFYTLDCDSQRVYWLYETGSRRRGRFIYLLCEQGRQHRRHLISCVPTFVWSPQSTPAPPQGAPGQDAYCRQAWKFNADLSPQALASERGGRGAWSRDMGVAWRCLMQLALHYTRPPLVPPWQVTPCCLAASSVGGCTCHTQWVNKLCPCPWL